MTKPSDSSESVEGLALSELQAEEGGPRLFEDGRLDVIKNVNVTLEVVVGGASLTVDELFKLREGSVVDLDRDADAPLDILLDGRVVARGDLVAVDDRFGIRVTEIGS